MNRTHYFNYIEQKLGVLAYRINQKGRLNILDLHIHSENFYPRLLNLLYDWNFKNVNSIKQNVEGIDLVDDTNNRICQVSATNTKTKVESALAKAIMKKYPKYTFKFISISKEGTALRKDTFSNPHGITFNPENDIIDNKSILDAILILPIEKQKELSDFIRSELADTFDVAKLETNLAVVINILSKEDLRSPEKLIVDSFQIDRKIDYNNLQKTRELIEEFAPYNIKVSKQYGLLDTLGANKSLSVLRSINKSYVEESTKTKSIGKDNLFLKVISNVIDKVHSSANYVIIPLDELDFCVSVLVVDAFIRCKIFKNPSDYQYASTGQYPPSQLSLL